MKEVSRSKNLKNMCQDRFVNRIKDWVERHEAENRHVTRLGLNPDDSPK